MNAFLSSRPFQIIAVAVLVASSAGIAGFAARPVIHHPPDIEGAAANATGFHGYTWRPDVATDASGNLLPNHPRLADAASVPHGVEQLVPGFWGEPSTGATAKGNLFVVVGDKVQRSEDHGVTWKTVQDFVSLNYPQTVDRYQTLDPILWVDPDTNRVFVEHIHGAAVGSPYFMGGWCTYLGWSDDEGASWTSRDLACDTPDLVDHQKLVTAHWGPKALPRLPTASYPNVLYNCMNKQVVNGNPSAPLGSWCAVSYDGGATTDHTVGIDLADSHCGGINGSPAAYPDGTVVVPLGGPEGCTLPPQVAVTQDNGLTWEVRAFNGKLAQTEIDPDITVTPDGTAYIFVRSATDQLGYLLRSHDKFQTWDGPFKVALPGQTLNVFTAITSGDNGRIALAYLATIDHQKKGAKPVTPSTAAGGTEWHLFVATSFDATAPSPTFITQQVTPNEDPVQVGCVWLRGGSSDCRNLLDFIDLAHDKDGRFIVAFTDGCTPRNGCTGDVEAANYKSQDGQVAVAVTASGDSLFAAHGRLAPLALTAPAPLPK